MRAATDTLVLGDVEVDVLYKDIRNVHLSVHPPTGRVRLSAPLDTSREALRAFAITKLGWIRRHQRNQVRQERETPREFLERESHYVWGRRYLLEIEEADAPPAIELSTRTLVMRHRPGADAASRRELLARWYRDQVRAAAPPLISKWEPVLGVKLERFAVRQLRTMWGSCTPKRSSILLNTELAKKPAECLEYIVVHELAHLLEPTHNDRFTAIMDAAMPGWRGRREILNQLPLRHEDWSY
ncbi:MAG: SprT family zinc-dependent metalloprotease [Phycisphaerales bacterium]